MAARPRSVRGGDLEEEGGARRRPDEGHQDGREPVGRALRRGSVHRGDRARRHGRADGVADREPRREGGSPAGILGRPGAAGRVAGVDGEGHQLVLLGREPEEVDVARERDRAGRVLAAREGVRGGDRVVRLRLLRRRVEERQLEPVLRPQGRRRRGQDPDEERTVLLQDRRDHLELRPDVERERRAAVGSEQGDVDGLDRGRRVHDVEHLEPALAAIIALTPHILLSYASENSRHILLILTRRLSPGIKSIISIFMKKSQ